MNGPDQRKGRNSDGKGQQASMVRKASIKETGEELSEADWARFDAAVASAKAERAAAEHRSSNPDRRVQSTLNGAERPRPIRR